jgi:cytochrome c-type biogenesis protein CcsB
VAESLVGFDDRLMLSAIVFYAMALLAFAARSALRGPSPGWGVPAPTALGARARPASVARPRTAGRRRAPDTRVRRSLSERAERSAVALTTSAIGLHAAAVVARGVQAGRAPWGNMYEYATGVALAASVCWLLVTRRQTARYLGTWVVGMVVLTLGLAVTVLYTPADDLVPALNSYWLAIHVAAAIIAGGVFTVGAAASLLYLVRLRLDRLGSPDRSRPSLPTAAGLDRLSCSATLFAFPVWTFAVIAGAIWAEDAWGRYWGWDPKETWAFITWVLYAAYLHAGSTAGWRGRRAHLLALAGYLAFVFNFFGVNMWITGLHSYAGV